MGRIERLEFHPKAHPCLAERVALVIRQMQADDFRWVPGHKDGEPVVSSLEFMMNFGTSCHDPM